MPRYAPSATGGPMGVRRSGLIPVGTVFSPLDLSPALWTDPSDASSVTISGSSGAYIGPNGLVCPGSGTNVAVSVDVGTIRPTGDFTLFADVTATDWTPAAFYHIASSGDTATAATSNWYLYLQTTGTIILYRPTGATGRTYTSSVATGVTDGTRKKIKVTFDQDNGSTQSEVKFYLSDDGSSWTQLGTTQTNASTGAGNSNTTAPRFGLSTGLTGAFGGTIHRVAVWSDLTETTKVFDADFEAATPYVSAFTESALGAPVYVVSSTATSATANYSYVGPTGLVCSGVGLAAIATSPDTADRYEIAGDIDVIGKVAATDWTPATDKTIVGRSTSSAQAWYLKLDTAGTLTLIWYTAGASGMTAVSTVATGVTDGATKWVRATLDVDNGASGYDVKFYLSDDGTAWTQLGTTVTGVGTTDIRASANDMRVGSRYAGTDNCWSGTIMRATVKNGIGGTAVFDADFVTAADYCATFTETGTGAGTVTIDTTNTPSAAAGALVSQINDLSGNARHLAQATAAKMPKYWNGKNGYNMLVFDGTSDVLSTSGTVDLTAGYTLLSVFRIHTLKAYNGLLRISPTETTSTDTRAEIYAGSDGKIQQTSNRYGTISGAKTAEAHGTVYRTYRISVPTDVEAAVTSSLNNSASTFTFLSGANNLPDDAQRAWMGLGYSTGGYFDGTFGEWTLISPEVTAGNETSWETYANTKWAVY